MNSSPNNDAVRSQTNSETTGPDRPTHPPFFVFRRTRAIGFAAALLGRHTPTHSSATVG
jgi:hypothetical protein